MRYLYSLLAIFFAFNTLLLAQSDPEVEEVVVVGSQIKGASITDVLPVTVISTDDIEALGVSDGDELIDNLVEQGLNFFNEQEQASGGVNAARGDTGAYNIRSMGVGNTLTLLNGRRMVNNAGYQTETIGGDFVPTVTVNTNIIPTNGLDRLEILRDGASAIYGADAIAGVVNNVLETDYVGQSLSIRTTGYDHFDATNTDISFKFGVDLNGGATNVSVFAKHRDRDAISASEDERWYSQNYERYLPADSSFFGAGLNNTSTYGWFQLDLSGSGVGEDWHAPKDGETEMASATDPRGGSALCALPGAVLTGFGTCMFNTDLGNNRSSQRGLGDYKGEMQRNQIFVFVNHEFDNGMELFSEIGLYKSDSSRYISQGSFKSGIFSISPDYYWFSQLPASMNFPTNKSVGIDGWRPFNKGRFVNVEKENNRLLVGLRGETEGGWDWEMAVTDSTSESSDVSSDRISYPALYQQFRGAISTTPDAFNIFDPNWSTNNGDNILVDVRRDDESTLRMFDVKFSHPEIAQLPAGPVSVLIGFEAREETYDDDRDPLLDGTITNQVCCGVTSTTRSHPFTSAVMGSSPTVDVYGEKDVESAFVEFILPITEKLTAQLAARHEEFSDSDSATVGRLALGYDYSDSVRIRGSYSTAFRPPNLIQVNQPYVTRSGTREDALHKYVIYKNNNDTQVNSGSGFLKDYTIFTLNYRLGNPNLRPEESTNATLGVVLTPTDNLTITVDRWSIEKENTIGLFGRINQSIYDLLLRVNHGIGGATTISEMLNYCAGVNVLQPETGKYAIAGSVTHRDQYTSSSTTFNQMFLNAGVCPAGQQDVIYEPYSNLATRTVEGTDLGIYYDIETGIGDFNISLQSSETTKFYQEPSNNFATIQAAIDSGVLPAYTALDGYGDLRKNENVGTDRKHSLKVNYRRGDWGASMTTLRLGSLFDNGVKNNAGVPWNIGTMTTTNMSIYKKFQLGGNDARLRLMVRNVADVRAPLADGWFGFYSDIHRDEGRHYYLDLKVDF